MRAAPKVMHPIYFHENCDREKECGHGLDLALD